MSENGVVKLMRAWREGFRAVPMEECDDAGAQARSDALVRGILEDADALIRGILEDAP